jgi:hypothetical protein
MLTAKFHHILKVTFVLALLISASAFAQDPPREVRNTQHTQNVSRGWRWPWQSQEPINNDRLVNPAIAPPPMQQPVPQPTVNALQQVRTALTNYVQGQPQPQPAQQVHQQTWAEWAYNGLTSGVQQVTQWAMQIPGVTPFVNWTQEKLARFQNDAKEEAFACRRVASHMGGGTRCGNRAKGMCMQATREFDARNGILRREFRPSKAIDAIEGYRGPDGRWVDGYKTMKNNFGQPLFVDISHLCTASSQCPIGARLIYEDVTPGKADSLRFGHIETRIALSGDCQFSSDHCNPCGLDDKIRNPNTGWTNRRLKAVFLRTDAQDI